MRISCSECHMFVDLPDRAELLGRFACADCRRERDRAGTAQLPADQPRRPAQRLPTALSERRRARRSSSPPAANPSAAAVVIPRPAPVPAPAEPMTARVEEPAPPRPNAPAARLEPPNGGSSTPGWVLPEAALAPPPRTKQVAVKPLLVAAVLGVVALAGTAVLVRPPVPDAPPPELQVPATPAARPSMTATATTRAAEAVDRTAAIHDELNRLASQADRCRKPGDAAGVARLRITVSPSGHARQVTIERGAFSAAKDRVGSCLTALFQRAKVEPFSGESVTVVKSVVVR